MKVKIIMPRKVKSRLAPKIIKVFENKEAEELPFEAIFDAIGGKKATVVGVLSSYPGVFSKSEGRRQTQWRLIPDDEISLDEIMELYGFTPEVMMEIVDSDTKNIRYACWQAPVNSHGLYERRDIHYINHMMRKRHFKGLSSASL